MALLLPGDRTGSLRILTWNLFHGRSEPPAGRDLQAQFSRALASWQWDAALLQEVPPWWPGGLARAAGAEQRTVLTSRNLGLPLRRLLASRWPDLMRANGGGSNAVLARQPIVADRRIRLRPWPERRVAQLVRLAGGVVLANYHASTREPLAEAELERLWEIALAWAQGAPLVLAGDLNLRRPGAPGGALHAGARDVDHVFVKGLEPHGAAEVLAREVQLDDGPVQLSDHPPLLAQLR